MQAEAGPYTLTFCIPPIINQKLIIERDESFEDRKLFRVKLKGDGDRLYALLDVVPVPQPFWIINPDPKGAGTDLFSATLGMAKTECIEDLTLIPDFFHVTPVAMFCGKALIGPKMMPLIRAVWCPNSTISGMVTGEVIFVTSFMPMTATVDLCRSLQVEREPLEEE